MQKQPPAVKRKWTIPVIPKSFNSLNWGHWRKKHAEAERMKTAALALGRGPWLRAPSPPPRRVRLTFTCYRKALQDPGNDVQSFKYLVDAMQQRGWLVDDNHEWLELVVTEVLDRKNTRTEIDWEAV